MIPILTYEFENLLNRVIMDDLDLVKEAVNSD